MDLENVELLHHIQQSIKAHGAMKRDIDYLVQDDKVLIVDEQTGRILDGRRYSDGLHQALEAKEGVTIQRTNASTRPDTLLLTHTLLLQV